MPKTLRWATVLLALVAVAWIAFTMLGLFGPPGNPQEIEYSWETKEESSGAAIIGWLVLAIVQLVLCTLARAGRTAARVLLTITSVALGLALTMATISILAEYADLVERAEVLGGEAQITGVGVVSVVLGAVSVVLAVLGLVLLYLPKTNAFYAEVRRLRREAVNGEPGPPAEA